MKLDSQILRPHDFGAKLKVLNNTPHVFISETALYDMQCIVGIASQEIGWLGTVYKRGNDFLVDEIFIAKQKAHSTTCEMSGEGVAELTNELLQTEHGVKKVNALRFWGHSHVQMGTSPSGQDEAQVKDFLKNVDDFFIRGILNKKGRMELDLYYLEKNFCIFDVPWTVETSIDESRSDYWEKEIKEKVNTFTYETFHGRDSWPNNRFGQQSNLWEDDDAPVAMPSTVLSKKKDRKWTKDHTGNLKVVYLDPATSDSGNKVSVNRLETEEVKDDRVANFPTVAI